MEFLFPEPIRKWLDECIYPEKLRKKLKNRKILIQPPGMFFSFSKIFCWPALQFLFSDRPDFVFHNKNSENLAPGVWYGVCKHDFTFAPMAKTNVFKKVHIDFSL